ncbi:MAG: DUF3667 domain-containing protein [Bacteroidota bacterium]
MSIVPPDPASPTASEHDEPPRDELAGDEAQDDEAQDDEAQDDEAQDDEAQDDEAQDDELGQDELGQDEPDRCANCGQLLSGAYCAACGQKDQPLRQPFHRVAVEAVTELLGIDGRLWRSVAQLVLPGRLTRAYLDGRRVRYVRPLRLYLLATLFFFFLVNVVVADEFTEGFSSAFESDSTMTVAARLAEIDEELGEHREEVAELQTALDSLRVLADSATAKPPPPVVAALRRTEDRMGDLIDTGTTRAQNRLAWQRAFLATLPPDSLVRPVDYETAAAYLFPGSNVQIGLPTWARRGASIQRVIAARTDAERGAAFAAFFRSSIRQIPTVMFLLLPVFALLLKVVYLRRNWYYGEHLVFALHVHAFAFGVFAVVTVAALTPLGGWGLWLLLLIPLYVYLAQQHVYRQGWIKTALKGGMLGFLYVLALAFGLVLALLLAAAVG